jgi:hypothetical protein
MASGKTMMAYENRERQEILKVVLKDGVGAFAIDVSAAFLGYYDSVIPWQKYVDERVRTIVNYHEPRSPPQEIHAKIGAHLTSGQVIALRRARWANAINHFLNLGQPQSQEKKTHAQIMNMPKVAYEKKSKQIQSWISFAMKELAKRKDVFLQEKGGLTRVDENDPIIRNVTEQ